MSRTIRVRDPDSAFTGRYNTAGDNANSNHAAKKKNPKRVAAGKMVAERTRLASEQQKKALSEASIILANNKAKPSTPAPERAPPTEDSEKK